MDTDKPDARAHILPCLRVVALALVFSGLAIGLGAHAARARLDGWLFGLCENAAPLTRTLRPSRSQRLHVNGLTLQLTVRTSRDSVEQALDQERRWCSPGPGDSNALRRATHEHGYLVCFEPRSGALSLGIASDRARAFLEDFDAAHFGTLHFVLVEHQARETLVVHVSSDGPLPLLAAFQNQHDAPGRDLPGVPRPAGSRRALSAWDEDHAQALEIYRAPATGTQALVGSYRAALERAGFRVLVPHREGSAGPTLMLARGADRDVAVCISETRGGFALVLLAALS